MCLHNLLLLPHLLAKLTKGEKPLLITPRHIVTFVENLNILRRKAMDNVVVKEILKGRWKEKGRQMIVKINKFRDCNKSNKSKRGINTINCTQKLPCQNQVKIDVRLQ